MRWDANSAVRWLVLPGKISPDQPMEFQDAEFRIHLPTDVGEDTRESWHEAWQLFEFTYREAEEAEAAALPSPAGRA